MFVKSLGLVPLSIIMVLILIMGSASAQPGIPNKFHGRVTINGVSAPDGVLVEARVFGDYVSGTTTSGGTYGQEIEAFHVPDPHGTMDGKIIEFYVQNVKAADYVFNKNDPSVELDLSVSISNFCGDGTCDSGESSSSCPNDCETSTTTGGGSSIITGGEETPEEEEEQEACVEDWICTDWTECVSGKKSRTCADVNRCGTFENQPEERQSCLTPATCEPGETMCRDNVLMVCSSDGASWTDLEECEFGCSEEGCLKGGFPFTGMIAAGLPAMMGLIIIIVLAILGYYFVRIRR